MSSSASAGNAATAVEDAAVILLGEAKILDGELPDDPADFSARIAKLMEKGLT